MCLTTSLSKFILWHCDIERAQKLDGFTGGQLPDCREWLGRLVGGARRVAVSPRTAVDRRSLGRRDNIRRRDKKKLGFRDDNSPPNNNDSWRGRYCAVCWQFRRARRARGSAALPAAKIGGQRNVRIVPILERCNWGRATTPSGKFHIHSNNQQHSL